MLHLQNFLSPPINPMNLEQKDILIVDDTPMNLRYLTRILTEQGFQVRKALNGQMALTACQTTLPDLILLDIMMPEMDGYEVCQHLKADEKTCKIPVIFLSALDDVLDKVKAFNAGGVDYITKPFQFEEVIIRVQTHLKLRDAEQKISQMNEELEQRVHERTQQLEQANAELQREIRERQQLQTQLLHIALHDPLTNLPNRALFMERLAAAFQEAKDHAGCDFAVLFLDCDRFKVVNDSLGHLVGDELLIAIARRLESMLTSQDILARLGGDEFAILLHSIQESHQAAQVAEKILQQLSQPFQLSRYEVFINASIGIAIGATDSVKPEYLLRDADTAMYRAKAQGKGRYHIFDPSMHQQALQSLQLENNLRRAIEREEFIVYYQPIVSLKTGKISGFESLVRWQHPTQGMISPAHFIPVAEEIGLIALIDLWVLKTTCMQLSRWQTHLQWSEPLTGSVNLSSRLFSEANLLETIDTILSQTNINPQTLKLEITESVMMENQKLTKYIIEELKNKKIKLCIDDFGTGYSSLSYLENFPADCLKIDQSFIKHLDQNSPKRKLVPGIINIAQTIGMEVIAEGVEKAQHLESLRTLNCDFGQGYYFAKPLDSQSFFTLLETTPTW
jgi:diguanylate cyclase (GGDEF)-like protein